MGNCNDHLVLFRLQCRRTGATQASARSRQEISIIWTNEEIVLQTMPVVVCLSEALKKYARGYRHSDAHCLISKKKQWFGCRMGVRHPNARPLEEQRVSSSCHLFEPSFGRPSPAVGPAGSPRCSFGSRSTVAELWHVGALARGCVQ